MPKPNDIPMKIAEQMTDATTELMDYTREELLRHNFFLLDSESTDRYIADLRPHLEAACADEPNYDKSSIRVISLITGFGAKQPHDMDGDDIVFAIIAVVLEEELTSMNFVAAGPYNEWCDRMAKRIAERIKQYMDAGAELAKEAMMDVHINEDVIH